MTEAAAANPARTATNPTGNTTPDEYDIYFHSADDMNKVFNFYRDYLTQQGFKVSKSEDKKHGFKANLARGQGGPDDTIELDVKMKHGRHKVEIKFDE